MFLVVVKSQFVFLFSANVKYFIVDGLLGYHGTYSVLVVVGWFWSVRVHARVSQVIDEASPREQTTYRGKCTSSSSVVIRQPQLKENVSQSSPR